MVGLIQKSLFVKLIIKQFIQILMSLYYHIGIFSECTVVDIGKFTKYRNSSLPVPTSGTVELETLIAEVPAGLECPSRVNENNWVNSNTRGPYEFRVTQTGNQVTVDRIDVDSVDAATEGSFLFFDLAIYCCPKGN